ncbi:hypothetical protein AVEN_155397-1 [Araneus ventricosus]|uniref:CCHC-type domain-containing protein n=1 Tax=Araneus ventricosus TaxID=182803 RepID=A0A4Y2HVV8_ARAVE|nr:hypothetical protein AVEN_155397-1 [Araneus ventricosus]
MGLEITSEDRVIDICKKIKNSPDYEEEFARGQLDVIVQEWESEIAQAELVRKERETERAYELEKLKVASAAETVSLNSTCSKGNRARPNSPKKEHPAKNAEKTEHQFGKTSAPKGNWRSEKFERRTQPACYICHSTSHLRPKCPQINKSKELVNRVGISEQVENLFVPYLSKALVNDEEMDILRDTGASIYIVSRNRVRPENFTGEVVFVKQPLDAEFRCLPLSKVEIQNPEFGCIITKAAVIDAQLDSDWY